MIGNKPIATSNITNLKVMLFRVALDAGNAPTLSEGRGATAARTGVGVYTLTLIPAGELASGSEFKGMSVTLNQAAGTVDLRATTGGYNSSTGVATFYTSLTSTGAQANPPAAGAQNFVTVELYFGSPTD